MTFDPTSVEVLCVTLPKDHCVQVPWKYIKVCGYSDPFCKKLEPKVIDPWWPLTPHLLRSHVWLYPRIIVSKSHGNTSKYVNTVINFANDQRSLTPRWPLTPHLFRAYVWLYPRIIVSKSHENTLKYVDTVTLFAKTWTKGHWPLDDLWPPHLLRSHVWLYPRITVSKSHGNTSMYVDTVINFENYHIHTTKYHGLRIICTVHDTTYILRTYYVQNQWSHSLSQARQQKLTVVNAAEARFPSCSHDLSIWK